jgi:hypothetical protein
MPNPQAGGPPLVGCPWLLIQYICSCPPYLFPPSTTWGCAMPWVQGTHLTWLHNYSCENLKSYSCGLSSDNCTGSLIEFEQMNAWNIKFHQQCFNMEMYWWYARKSCNPFGLWNIFLGIACITNRCLPEWSKTNYTVYWYWSDISPADGIVMYCYHRQGK